NLLISTFSRPRIFSRLRTPVLDRSCLISFSLCRAGRTTSRSMSSSATPFEEEKEVGFENFYPMTFGDVINENISTIWCCRNLATNKYAALKTYAHDLVAENEIDNETAIYKHLSTAGNPDHPDKIYFRTIQDSFFVMSRAGNPYQCLVHEVLSNDILSLRYTRPDCKLPETMLEQILIQLPLTLDFLHSECHITHIDIKEESILLGLVDSSIRKLRDIPTRLGRRPILCDFSLARNGQVEHCHDIQPGPYRAPDVIIEMPWAYAVDIWNVGVMVRDFLLDPEAGKYGNRFHLASIVGLLGPPPLEFLQRSDCSSVYFDDRGNRKCLNPVLSVSWEDSERNLEVSNKKGFLSFVCKIVRWTPESRASPSELLEDPWLLGDVEE
ncbi:kinase-like domain-containing protein, partial [Bisporella sp. PMI_857]